MSVTFAPATRSAAKARIALAGPSGSGKTYLGLAIGCYLAAQEKGRLAVIDTERGSASKYVGLLPGWEFDSFAPQSFDPSSLVEALGAASGAGYPAVLIDSWSHYWMGVDGMLEQVDRKTSASRSGSSYNSGWKEMAPVERRMLEAIVGYPGHIIATLRVKTEYVLQEDERGKKKPVKVGLKPQQRDGLEYEFDVVADLDHEHTLTVSKTRVPMLSGAVLTTPGEELGATIADWLADGEDVPGPLAYRAQALDAATTFEDLRQLRDVVQAAGLMNAPVTDAAGAPTVLGDLIYARAKEIQLAESGQAQERAS